MKKKMTNAERQLEMAKKTTRKMRQDIHKPMIIPNKKKQADKLSCRRFCYC